MCGLYIEWCSNIIFLPRHSIWRAMIWKSDDNILKYWKSPKFNQDAISKRLFHPKFWVFNVRRLYNLGAELTHFLTSQSLRAKAGWARRSMKLDWLPLKYRSRSAADIPATSLDNSTTTRQYHFKLLLTSLAFLYLAQISFYSDNASCLTI